MFENAIGLDPVTEQLKTALRDGTLPQAVLLHGPRFSGKGTVALEIARALTCRQKAAWNCSCRSCTLHRTLSHPDIVLAGPRYFDLEIAAATRAWETEPRTGTLYLLIRAIRKLVRRFDPFLWPEVKLRKILPLVEGVEEVLQEVEPAVGMEDLPTGLNKLVRPVSRLVAAVPHEIVPVDLVRNLSSWAQVSSTGPAKVVLFEEVHTLQDSARNSMLKILEEPPSGVWFVLTTTRRGAVMPTLLSRLRSYGFPLRTPQQQQEVISKIFRSTLATESTLDQYFRQLPGDHSQQWTDVAAAILETSADSSAEHLLAVLATLRSRIGNGNSRTNAEFLLQEIALQLREPLGRVRGAGLEDLRCRGEAVRLCQGRITQRNMNPLGVLSDLVLSFREGLAQ